MRQLVAVLVLPVTLAACKSPPMNEASAERPELSRQSLLERSGPGSYAAAGGTAPSCALGSESVGAGTLSCRGRQAYRCVNGIWEKTTAAC